MIDLRNVPGKALAVIAGGVMVAVLATSAVSAHGSQRSENHGHDDVAVGVPVDTEKLAEMKAEAQQRATDAKQRVEKAKADAEQRRTEAKANAKAKLTEAKQRMCERRETVINNTLDRIGKRGYRHIEVIGRISDRTQAYYKEKGLTVADYDTLVANIASAKATADSAAKAVQDAQADFGCTDNDPKAASGSFAALVQARADAVKAYRDAVKALVVAVKAAAQASSKTDESGMILAERMAA